MFLDPAKYVIIDGSVIVFSAAIQHKDMVGYNEKCESAGFVKFYATTNEYGETVVKANAYGESISLGIKSNPEKDTIRINMQICGDY